MKTKVRHTAFRAGLCNLCLRDLLVRETCIRRTSRAPRSPDPGLYLRQGLLMRPVPGYGASRTVGLTVRAPFEKTPKVRPGLRR